MAENLKTAVVLIKEEKDNYFKYIDSKLNYFTGLDDNEANSIDSQRKN